VLATPDLQRIGPDAEIGCGFMGVEFGSAGHDGAPFLFLSKGCLLRQVWKAGYAVCGKGKDSVRQWSKKITPKAGRAWRVLKYILQKQEIMYTIGFNRTEKIYS
jgi:hypothetical protein